MADLITDWGLLGNAFLTQALPNLSHRWPDLVVPSISIIGYYVLIYMFYRFVAKRDVFGFDEKEFELERHDSFRRLHGTVQGLIKYGLFFPVIMCIWFAGFALIFFMLAKNLPTDQILLVSVGLVTAIRVTAYYTEDLSVEIAKLIPLVLLGVSLIEPGFFSVSLVMQRIGELEAFVPDLMTYFIFVVLVEWMLRILLLCKHLVLGVSHPDKKQ